jgi:predicted transcriptional regulator
MDKRNSEPKDVELSTTDQQEKTIRSGDLNVEMNLDALNEVKKKYKKIKKYMRSSLFAIKMMDGNEKVVTNLIKNTQDTLM